MARLLLCFALLCILNCTVQAQIPYDSYVTRNGGFQQGMALKYQMTDNILYNAPFFPAPSPPHRLYVKQTDMRDGAVSTDLRIVNVHPQLLQILFYI